MSSYVQHFSDWSHWWCLDDYFWPHEYGYIKLKDETEWYNLWDKKEWKHRVVNHEEFRRCTKWLWRVYEVVGPEGPSPVENIWSIKEELTQPCNCNACKDGIAWEEPIDWQPSPNEEIEVSDDWHKWYKADFIQMHWEYFEAFNWFVNSDWSFARPLMMSSTSPWIYICNVDTENWQYAVSYKYARQLPQEDIELPEWKASGNTPWCLELTSMATHLELLTSVVNQLIKANKK